jgi:hypothetical protein
MLRILIALPMLLALLLVGACNSNNNGSNTNNNNGSDAYTIAGTVTGAGADTTVTLSLTGTANNSVTAASSGAYSFLDLANGVYTITHTAPGYLFSPTSQPVTLNGANKTAVNFAATIVTATTVPVNNDITANTTWTAGNVYLIDNQYQPITVSAVLTIQPGAIIKFPLFTAGTEHYRSSMAVSGNGAVIANGDAAAPIVFTSIRDDAHGGDSDSDGGAIAPHAGNWAGIRVSSESSVFKHCQFFYAGHGDTSALAFEQQVTADLENSVFAHNHGTDSLDAYPTLLAVDVNSSTVIKVNLFYDNFVPVWIGPNFSFDDSNFFDNSAASPASPQSNKYNGVFLMNPDGNPPTILSNIAWSVTKVPLVVESLYVDAALTLSHGVIVKFRPWAGGQQTAANYNHSVFIEHGGTITASGTGSAPVVFTSINDDTVGGDTNGDGGAVSAAAGDWAGMNVSTSGSSFQGCQFNYAFKSRAFCS